MKPTRPLPVGLLFGWILLGVLVVPFMALTVSTSPEAVRSGVTNEMFAIRPDSGSCTHSSVATTVESSSSTRARCASISGHGVRAMSTPGMLWSWS